MQEILEMVNGTFQRGHTTYLTHNFHPYAAKFIPQIPRLVIQTYSRPGQTVLDPFCGSGTTLVESKLLGRASIGVDINPIGAFMSKVKTTKLRQKEFEEIPRILGKISKNVMNILDKNSYPLPIFHNRDHWFSREMLRELSMIRGTIIEETKAENLKDFLLLGFASIIVSCSNQDSETRYAAIEKKRPRGYCWQCFDKKIKDMVARMRLFDAQASNATVKVYCADSRKLNFLNDKTVDLIVTSPPYPNTYDYYLYHKMRMFWLGLNWENAKVNEIGSRLRHSSKNEGIDSYLSDMKLCFLEFNRVLHSRKRFAIVLGDSIINGEKFDGEDLVTRLAEESEFEVEDNIKYNLGRSSKTFNKAFRNKEKNEHVLVLRKS